MSIPNFESLDITSIEDIVRAIKPHISEHIAVEVGDDADVTFSLIKVPTRTLKIQLQIQREAGLVVDSQAHASGVKTEHMIFTDCESLVDATYLVLAEVRAWFKGL